MTIGIDPVAFTIGSVNIRWYGIMIAIGVLVLVLWTYRQAKKYWPELSTDTVMALAIVGIPSGISFARLLHVIDRWDYFIQNPGRIIGGEGLTIYGAILGAFLGTWVYSRFKPFNYWRATDLVAPGITLAQAIGRIGCIINGCCYGTTTSLPWAISYTHPASEGFGVVNAHPTQAYEIIFLLLLFGILVFLRGRLKPDGSLFLVYISSYSLWRLGIDFIRPGTDFLFGLHQAQVIGIIALIIAAFVLIRHRVHRVKAEESPPEEG